MPPKPRFATLTSWSYSVYHAYCECPFKVCLDKVQRVRIEEPPNEHFIKGDRVHKSVELQVGGKGRPPKLEPELDKPKLRALLADLRRRKARVELEWAFDRGWNPVRWYDKDAWLRIKTDACADSAKPPVVDIIDWKTGKQYPEHAQQRSLYALGGLRLVQIGALAGGSEDVQLTAQHVYVDTGLTATEKYAMCSLAPLQREWLARIKAMMSDTQFKTATGYHCRYCKFRKSAGGSCPENM
jgi:hypothetical protein